MQLPSKMLRLVGLKTGYLVVEKFHHVDTQGNYTWLCRCKCGNKGVIAGRQLTYQHQKYCSTDCPMQAVDRLLATKEPYRTNALDVLLEQLTKKKE
jgi:hypothetical protein